MTKTVFVTGGNRGIGLEVVRGLAKEGHKVLLGCRDEDSGNEVVQDIVGGDVHVVEIALNNEQAIIDPLVRAEAVYGPVDILINNAGVMEDSSLEDLSMEAFDAALQVNLKAPLTLIKQVLPGMRKRGFGRIVNVSSGWGAFYEGMEGPLAYAVSKAALNALTLNVARTLDDDEDVKVNSVCPGWVHTRMGGKDAPRSPEQGAESVIWAATQDKSGPNGKFIRDKEVINW